MKEDGSEVLLCGYQETLCDATGSPKATTTFLSGRFTTGWLTVCHSLLI